MTSFISVIVAIMVALTGMCGSVAGIGRPVSVEAGITMDGDLSVLAAGAGEEAAPAFEAITGILNALSLRFAADASVARMDVMLNGASAASLAVKAADEGWEMVSSLFPSTQLTVKNETIESAAQGLVAQSPLASLDQEALTAAIAVPLTQLIIDIQATAGEPETGSWTVGGKEYTTKVTYNITTKEALEKILTTLQAILNDEQIAGLISSLGNSFDPSGLEEALNNLRESDEAEMPVLSAADYTNEAGDTCTEILLAKDEQSMSLIIATAGQNAAVNLDILGQLTVELLVDGENKQIDLNGSFTGEGTAMTLTGSLKQVTDDSADFSFAVTMPVGEAPISLGIKGTVASEAPVFEAAEGANVVSLESLMEDEEAATAFSNELQMSAVALLGSLMQQFPGLVTLMNTGAVGE